MTFPLRTATLPVLTRSVMHWRRSIGCHTSRGYAVEATDALALLHTLETRLTALVHTTTDANAVEAKPRIVVLVDDLWDAYDEALPEAGKDLIAKLIRIGRTLSITLYSGGQEF